ncbi:flagellar biosynthesis protein FlhB [Thioalkalivibrio sp. HL-Eb18]|uniref:flagellar biosynthesis protein FlhB n=1 Tax=Thioalkalivibrio sp. HL-Eb18 TaxID=1266913 RepID=UPI00036FFBEE|nr:flagellar biosynthesis protein FlhB [Thioalkalivibrio sp. HL-Eb18]
MAENESGQEKTEQPTPKRLREAKEKGQVPRSRELSTFLVLMAAGGFMTFFGPTLGGQLAEQTAGRFDIERDLAYDSSLLLPYLSEQIFMTLRMLLPLFGVLMVAAVLAPILIGGANFSWQAAKPKASKLNPLKGLKRIFSWQGLMEFGKTFAKFVLVAGVAMSVLWTFSDRLLMLGYEPLEQAIAHAAQLALGTFVAVSAALILVAAIDAPFQMWNHQKQLRMTRQELKDEYKETDGKPEVKQKIRQLQQEMAQRRMMEEVPKADVVITNPTHYAVAITYEASRMAAPKLVAKGVDEVAASIRAVADEHKIIRVEAPRVARAIYFTTDLNQEIPNGLFVAVARILAYVYQLKRSDADVAMPDDLPVPDDYLDPQQQRGRRRNR